MDHTGESHTAETLEYTIRTKEYILDMMTEFRTTSKAKCKHITNTHICTYFLPESGPKSNNSGKDGTDDTQIHSELIGTPKAGTMPLHL